MIGQEKAKKILAVAVYNHYSRVNENLRQQQIQESLTAISNSSVPPSSVYYGSSVLMSDGPSTPDPIIETFTSPSSPPSSASGTDAAGGSSNGGKDTHVGSSDLHVPGRRKLSTKQLPTSFFIVPSCPSTSPLLRPFVAG